MTLRLAMPLTAALALAACTTPQPQGVTDADIAAYRAAMETAGCVVASPEQAAVVETATGFDTAKLRAITDYLVEIGDVEQYGASSRLLTGACADA